MRKTIKKVEKKMELQGLELAHLGDTMYELRTMGDRWVVTHIELYEEWALKITDYIIPTH